MIDGTTIYDAEDGSNFSQKNGSLWFYTKDEPTNFDAYIAKTNDFKSFKYKSKLLEKTLAQIAPNRANEILKNAAIAVLLKNLSLFQRSLEMVFINWKLELKLEWTKYWVLFAASSYNYSCNVNEDVHNNNAIFTVKDTKVYAPVVTLSVINRKLSDFLVNELKEQFLGMNIKQKVRLKLQ